MKPISIHVSEQAYREFRALSSRSGRPIAELIRDAMARFLDEQRESGPSLLAIEPHSSGALKKGWTRSELLHEMGGS